LPLVRKYAINDEILLFQINYACNIRATPQKKAGRPPILTQAQELVEFVCVSKQNRRMSFAQLTAAMNFGVKKDAIRSALLKEGFHRRLAMRKPPISEKNRQLRLQWPLSMSQSKIQYTCVERINVMLPISVSWAPPLLVL